MATLDDYNSIRTALIVKIDVDYYWNGSGYSQQALTFTDNFTDMEFDSLTYTALGKLLSISPISSELRSTSQSLVMQISGIPNTSIQEITYSRLLSAPVYISRVFMDPDGQLLTLSNIDNPMQRYVGYIDNYSLEEEWDAENKIATNTITIDVNSAIDVVSKKVGGRSTSPASMKKYYPTDVSFDRVPALANQPVNFGR